MMEKIKELWEKLPKTVKVAVYLFGAGLLNYIRNTNMRKQKKKNIKKKQGNSGKSLKAKQKKSGKKKKR